jgi:hypothetical protein
VAFFFIDNGPQGHHGLSKSSSSQILWGYYWGYSLKIELGKKHGWGVRLESLQIKASGVS